MRSSIFLILATSLAALGTSYAAALPKGEVALPPTHANRVRNSCTATFTGANSEGGGGPGSQPIDQTSFSLSISGGSTSYFTDVSSPDGQSLSASVTAADYGGSFDGTFTAGWNPGGNIFNGCDGSVNGQTITGSVGPQSISTGTVSTTTNTCAINFDC